ncbi:MAG: tRNA lysidine(34) synthetase TilS [Actinobacteria bacterium]|nr:tRNA lysidine(34) synthetase TilS [Actinomycetota bacterium]MSY04793.1 tRNA lysidine(34) synthetase TilS [Actinomycetota bacterium]MSZ58761.1 tRNA lysidine(34) synthetase TilS [Actinomycetota bacterium]MTB26361.1 tRNA lysidine(34) synthetase TilS [Actinomycetota bacterium]
MIDARRVVRNALAHFEPGDRILLAVSGGADSLLLAAATNLEANKVGIQLSALVVDHQLQNGSGEVALGAQKKLIELGITEAKISQVEVSSNVSNGGTEAAARRARYEALDAEADRIGAVAIFLGHTEDDLAETVLLGLARGSGTRSLSGMAFHVGRYVRPFLELTRAQVLSACKESGIEFWSDPQNEELSFARVRVRNEILPKMEKEIGPGISKALARTSRILREDADALDLIAGDIFASLADPAEIPIESISELPIAVRKRVIKRAIEAMGAPTLSAEQILEVDALVGAWKGQGAVALAGGITARRDSGRLTLSK